MRYVYTLMYYTTAVLAGT